MSDCDLKCEDCGGKNGEVRFSPGVNREIPVMATCCPEINPVGFRKFVPPFRIFFTWDITYVCNYRCTYCIVFESPQWATYLSKKQRAPIPAEKWMEIWDGIYEKYGSAHVHCSGGEPFSYPRFLDILEHMTKKHTMECDTNLAFDVEKMIGRVQPGTFRFAASFHPEFADIEGFVAKCKRLRAAGYDLEGVNFIAWPPHLKDMPKYRAAFDEAKVAFTVIPFRGKFEGKDYPDAYTLEERKFINRWSQNKVLTEDYGSWYKGASQGGENTSRAAALCRTGQMYAKIQPDGNALRCCFLDDRGSLGNLIDGTFRLNDEATKCEFPACTCWKSMIVGEEERWLRHWVGVRR